MRRRQQRLPFTTRDHDDQESEKKQSSAPNTAEVDSPRAAVAAVLVVVQSVKVSGDVHVVATPTSPGL